MINSQTSHKNINIGTKENMFNPVSIELNIYFMWCVCLRLHRIFLCIFGCVVWYAKNMLSAIKLCKIYNNVICVFVCVHPLKMQWGRMELEININAFYVRRILAQCIHLRSYKQKLFLNINMRLCKNVYCMRIYSCVMTHFICIFMVTDFRAAIGSTP